MIIKKIINKISSYIYRISVLCKYKRKLSKSISFSDCKLLNEVNSTQRIAIHFHIFYIDLLDEIYTYIAHIKNPFTLYLTVVNEEDYIKTQKFFETHNHYFEIKIQQVENRGRDIYPFYLALHNDYSNFDIIAHFHTKKSLHTDFGDLWRIYLYDNLLGKKYLFDNLINFLETNKSIGFLTTPIIPQINIIESYFAFLTDTFKSKSDIGFALSTFGIPTDPVYKQTNNMDFPSGNMFIAKTNAIKQFFETSLSNKNFPDEAGQITGTLQHFVELMWKYMVLYNGFEYCEIRKR